MSKSQFVRLCTYKDGHSAAAHKVQWCVSRLHPTGWRQRGEKAALKAVSHVRNIYSNTSQIFTVSLVIFFMLYSCEVKPHLVENNLKTTLLTSGNSDLLEYHRRCFTEKLFFFLTILCQKQQVMHYI